MNRIDGEATITIGGETYRLAGPIRILLSMAKDDDRIEVVEPINLNQRFSVSMRLDEDAGRRLDQWIASLYRSTEVQRPEPRRRRAQWKDEQSRYGRKR